MKLRLTLTLDLARVRDEPPPPADARDAVTDAYVENATGSPRRPAEYPFGFTPHPEDDDT